MIDQKESMLHDVFPKLLTHRSILLWIGGIKSAFYQILQSFLFAPDLCYGYCIVEFRLWISGTNITWLLGVVSLYCNHKEALLHLVDVLLPFFRCSF
jgi:hypothetical protein